MFKEHDLERAQGHDLELPQGHDKGGLVSPRPPSTPGLSPRQRFPSATSSQNAVLLMDAAGRESVMSGAAFPASVADSFSESKPLPISLRALSLGDFWVICVNE